MDRLKLLFLFAFIIPFVFLYHSFFTPSHLAWGDAPFYYEENLKELFNIPLTWNVRNDNFGASQFHILWLFLPTYLFGVLNHFLGLNSDILIRLIFCLPASILPIIGSYLLIGLFVKDKIPRFLGSLFYAFNTYIIMLIDGGQIGVALAYGLFPFAIFYLLQYLKGPKTITFLYALSTLFFLSNIDIRIFLLSIPTFFILMFIERGGILKTIKFLMLLISCVVLLDLFWIIPTILNLQQVGLGTETTNKRNLISLLNALTLYQPHFPLNNFGKLIPVPFYYSLMPLLLFTGILVMRVKEKKYYYLGLCFLIIAFITKGDSSPLPGLYSQIVDKIFLGTVFRDSSKFFVPQLLLAGILIAFTVSEMTKKLNGRLKNLVFLATYFYIFILIYPAFGGLTGVLGNQKQDQNFQVVAKNLRDDNSAFRTLWFSEKPPLGFAAWGKESINASTLYKELPFAMMIKGEYDLFNYLNDPMLGEWLRFYGIKYVFAPPNERKKIYTPQELDERKQFTDFISSLPAFSRLNLPVSFPALLVDNPKPKIFTQDSLFLVLGGFDVVSYLNNDLGVKTADKASIFLEGSKVNIDTLLSLPKGVLTLISKDRERQDLLWGISKDYLINLNSYSSNEWGSYSGSQLLSSRYQLLNNGIESSDILFEKGMFYSTIAGERLTLELRNDSQRNILAIRSIATDSAGLKVTINGNARIISNNAKSFKWDQLGEYGQNAEITLENLGGFQAINTLVFIPREKYEENKKRAEKLVEKFGFHDVKDSSSSGKLLSKTKSINVPYEMINPTFYKIKPGEKPKWIIFTDHFDDQWSIDDKKPYPIFESVNGFYVDSDKELELHFKPQSLVIPSIGLSLISFVIIVAGVIIVYLRNKL